ncbi:SdrD B-like domain-containing protein [Spirosoma migulaei]
MKNLVPSLLRTVLWLGLFVAVSVMAKTFTATFLKDNGSAEFVASALLPKSGEVDKGKQVSYATSSTTPTLPQPTAACSLTLNRVDVSDCYSVSGVSKATISVEVGWQDGPTNDYIVVTTAGQSRTIVPGITTVTYPQPTTLLIQGTQNIVTPQVVAFEVALTGAASNGTVTAQFADSPSCQASQTFSLPAACPPTNCNGSQLGGIVYRDFNADGIQQTAETQGVSSVSVTAYDCNGTKYGPVLTDQYGKYLFSSTSIQYPVRVEFSDPSGVDVGTVYGANSKSNVQFVSQATCSVNLGIANPTLYCQSNPTIFIPCYTYGDPLNLNPSPAVADAALSANSDAIVSFPYDESNTAATGMTHIAEAHAVGTVWGLGYNRLTKDLFLSATLHRHAGLGPLGVGGLYVTHTSSASATTESFMDVSSLGIDVGAALVPVNGAGGRALSADKTKPSHDAAVFSLIGKVGIGGLEVSEDGQKLWFVNLYDKKLYSIDIAAYNTSGTKPTSAHVKSYTIPDPSCAGGSSRPWALHVYGGKLYVGTVCDALTSQNKSDMRAYVYAFDPASSAFSPVFDFPLTYPKGYGISPKNSPGQAGADSTGWYPWTDSFDDLVIATSTAVYKSLVHPQPMLADIEFDVDGSMVLGFADRTGLQGGYNNYSTDPSNTQLYTVNPAAGDILRAYNSNGSYILENNGKVGPFTGTGVTNNQGPGFGEFYDDNYFDGSKFAHTELALGGLALKPGSGHVVGATIDPVATVANSGGVKYWNNETGVAEAAAIVYTTGTDPGTFAKAAGLGELDLNCDLLQVIEIGNRAWVDTNKDGIQDPCEKSLADLQVDLYKGTTKIASTTTNAEGEYYFSNKANLTTGTWLGTGADTTLLATTAYSLVFGATQFSGNILTVNGSKLTLTGANSTTTNANDLNDSDALVTTVAGITAPVISLTTGNTGFVNHNFDVGFACVSTLVASVSVTPATCNTATQTAKSDAKINLAGITNADKAYLMTTSTIPSYTATGSTPVSASAVSFTGLANPTSTSGTSYSVVLYNGPCCYTVVSALLPQTNCTIPCAISVVVTAGTCQSATNQYTLAGTVSFTSAQAGSLTITDGTHSTTVAVSSGAPSVTFSLSGLISDETVHTVSVTSSATSCAATSTTYTAPASCTIAPLQLAVVVSTPVCNSATNQYSATGTVSLTNRPAGSLTITDNGTTIGVVSVTAGQTSASFSLSGSSNGPASHTVVASLANAVASAIYTVPASCTVCSLSLTTASLANGQVGAAYSQTLTTSGGTAPVSFTVSAGSLPAGLTLDGTSGVISGTPTLATTTSFTIGVLDSKNCSDTAPLTITTSAAPVCSLTVSVTNTACNPASNTYSSTVSVLLTNPVAGSITLSDGVTSQILTVTGSTSGVSGTFNGLIADGLVHTVSASLSSCGTSSTTYAAPISCSVIPTAGLGDYVFLDANKDGIQNTGDTPIEGVTVTLYTNGGTSATTVTDASGLYSFTGLTLGSSNSYVVGFTAPAGMTATLTHVGSSTADSDADPITGRTQSVTLAAGEFNPTLDAGFYTIAPTLSLDKFVDKSKAQIGDVLTYTIVVTNAGTTTATNLVVRDSSSIGLTYVLNSATAPAGTTFTSGSPVNTWTIASISAGQSLSLTFQAVADSSGILYNTAVIPGDTATACTSIPYRMCAGSVYLFQLTTVPGRSSYKWFKDNVEISGQTTNVLEVTAPGTYSLAVDNVTGKCPDFSCCPFIVEEDTLPTFQAVAVPVTCTGNTAQANGKIVLSGFKATYTYQYSLGTSFNESAPLSGTRQVIPVGGTIVSSLVNPAANQAYTIRVYNASGCYTDVTVMLLPTVCGCPPESCVPLVIRQTKRPARLGDSH